MITKKEGKIRRTIQVILKEHEIDSMRAAGFECNLLGATGKAQVMLCAEERDDLKVKRGVFAHRVSVDYTKAKGIEAHARKVAAFNACEPRERISFLLHTPEWRGSEVDVDTDRKGRPQHVLRHPSGARMWIYADAPTAPAFI